MQEPGLGQQLGGIADILAGGVQAGFSGGGGFDPSAFLQGTFDPGGFSTQQFFENFGGGGSNFASTPIFLRPEERDFITFGPGTRRV